MTMTKIHVHKMQENGDIMFEGRYVQIQDEVYKVDKIIQENKFNWIVNGKVQNRDALWANNSYLPGHNLQGQNVE